jgi:hypothetical protein
MAPDMSWMVPAKGQAPDIMVHVIFTFPSHRDEETEFPFVWGEFSSYPRDMLGSFSAAGDGRGPNGEGIGCNFGVRAECLEGGAVAIGVGAHWDLAGGICGSGRARIVLYPQSMREGEIERQNFGDGLVVKWWITR